MNKGKPLGVLELSHEEKKYLVPIYREGKFFLDIPGVKKEGDHPYVGILERSFDEGTLLSKMEVLIFKLADRIQTPILIGKGRVRIHRSMPRAVLQVSVDGNSVITV